MSPVRHGLWLGLLSFATLSSLAEEAAAAPPALEGVSWAVEYNNSTYHGIDVFATFVDENHRLLNVFNTSVSLSGPVGATFNQILTQQSVLTSKPAYFEDEEEAVIDTFVAIGGGQSDAAPFFVFDPSCPLDIFVSAPSIVTEGGWYNFPPSDGIQTAGPDLRIRIARFVLHEDDYLPGCFVTCTWTCGYVVQFGAPAQFADPSGTFWFTDELAPPPVDEPGQDFWFDSAGGCPPTIGPVTPPPPEPFGSLLNKSVIWTSPGGWVVGWELDGLALVGAEALTAVQPDNTVAAGSPDLDGDGDQDLLWRDPTSQSMIGCIVKDGVVFQTGVIAAPSSPVSDWKLLGQMDMTGDGRDDLVWRRISGGAGSVRVWQMNGLTREANVQVATSPGFEFLGLVDLNKDGKGDYLWRLANGAIMAWLGNGLAAPTAKMITGCGLVPLHWKLVAAPDLDGDGDSDIFWLNTANGNVNGWLIQGTKKVGGGLVAPAVGAQWEVADVADLDDDGDDDVVWRNVLFNTVRGWTMQGLTKQAGGPIESVTDGWAVLR